MFAQYISEASSLGAAVIISETTSFAEGKHHSKNAPLSVDKSAFFVGGDGGIRTLEDVLASYTISNRAPSTGLGDISIRHLIIITDANLKIKYKFDILLFSFIRRKQKAHFWLYRLSFP